MTPLSIIRSRRNRSAVAFTTVELMVALSVLMVILLIVFGITQQAANAWKSTSSKIEAFQKSRAAFETIIQNISQATLNVYYDYYDTSGNRRTESNASTFMPANYGRYSDLQFISGKELVTGQVSHSIFFQTPAGYSGTTAYQNMNTLLNACGYYVTYDKDSSRPAFLATLPNPPPYQYRFRLVQFLQPSENLEIYSDTASTKWFTGPISSSAPAVRQIADNVVALVFLPKDAQEADLTADSFEYDSRGGSAPTASASQTETNHQLPPLVEVILVTIDEPSAIRLCTTASAPDFGLKGLFQIPSSLENDLDSLQKTLSSRHINFRVFRTTVALRNSKWSNL